MMERPTYLKYWGKAARDGPGYHLLCYHSLDVAAVAERLMRGHRGVGTSIATLLGVSQVDASVLVATTMALHDLGKFSGGFQSKAPKVQQRLQPGAAPVDEVIHHSHAGWAIWRSLTDYRPRLPGSLVQAAVGHHGEPPKSQHPTAVRALKGSDVCDPSTLEACRAFVGDVLELMGGHPLPPIDSDRATRASWWVAGVGIIADWIGSNTEWFPYEDRELPLNEYWPNARARAARAVQEAGVMAAAAPSRRTWDELFTFAPTPMQQAVVDAPMAGPAIYLVEDVMGVGKTEAALYLAHRLITAGVADGLYFALPTQATANGLFRRVASVYPRLFGDSAPLVLAHSGRYHADLGGDTATGHATAWLADSNKRSLLAQVGVGTVDQALIGILHARHSTVRLAGLLRKVLIIDEVHGFDAYVNTLIERLIHVHALAGGSVILLSATLDVGARDRFLGAFRSGLNGPPLTFSNRQYPLLTSVDRSGGSERAVLAAPRSSRRVHFVHLEGRMGTELPKRVLSLVETLLRKGRCVAWIRNTVDDAARAFDWFAERLPANTLLFHSRFVVSDRAAIEGDLINRFGRESLASQRAGRLVIATQVIEQSLDLDFDVLVTDVAPIELLLQRAGRCQRHMRGFRVPRVFVVGPSPHSTDWLNEVGASRFVYRDQGKVWSAMALLKQRRTADLPSDAREWVDSVYRGDYPAPRFLADASRSAESELIRQGALGERAAISLEAGYARDVHDWPDDLDLTRLSRPMTEAVLFRRSAPIAGSVSKSSIRISGRWRTNSARRLDASWQVAIELDVRAQRDGRFVVPRYSEVRGFVYEEA